MASTLEIAKACDKLQGQVTSGPSSISQWASLKAIESMNCVSEDVTEMVNAFSERRKMVIEKLNKMPGIKSNQPEGAFYIYPNISHYFGKTNGSMRIENDTDFCVYMLEKAHIAIVPGAAFGNPNCVRISYATSKNILVEALDRMENALEELH